ncbi:MAG: putative bifunctional diguanylate cyclase/phosphodiesterase [Acidimicrobiales bacterium]
MAQLTTDIRLWLAGAVIIVASLALPAAWVDVVPGLVLLAVLVVVARRRSLLWESPLWRPVIGGVAIIGIAPMGEAVDTLLGRSAAFTTGDVLIFAGYLSMAVGLHRIITVRTAAPQPRAMLDAALVVAWAQTLLLMWVGPQATILSDSDAMVLFAYLGTLSILAYQVVRLGLGGVASLACGSRLVMACGLATLSEITFLIVALDNPSIRPLAVILGALGLLAMAAAIAHPTAADLATPNPAPFDRLHGRRVIYLACSQIAVVVLISSQAFPVEAAGGLIAVTLISSANIVFQIRERERIVTLEREIRRAVGTLLSASDRTSILQTTLAAVSNLLHGKRIVYRTVAARGDGGWSNALTGQVITRVDVLDLLERSIGRGRRLTEERPSAGRRGDYTTMLALPLPVETEELVLMVEAAPVLNVIETEQLTQLAETTTTALETRRIRDTWYADQADRRFRILVQDSGDIVLLVDPSSRSVEMVSPSLERLLGYQEATFLGRGAGRLIHPDDRETVLSLIERAGVAAVATADVRVRHHDGHFHWFRATVRALDPDEPITGVVMNLTDIQERKLGEISLVGSEQKYREMVLNADEVFLLLDADDTVAYVSPSVTPVLGYHPQDITAARIADIVDPADVERIRAAGEDEHEHDAVVAQIRTADGATRTARITVRPRPDADPGGYLLVVSDVTELHALKAAARSRALNDPLTGLPNRKRLELELEERLRDLPAGDVVGVIHLDIRDFKAVNESIGYEEANQVLLAVAARLERSVRSGAMLTRIGGNEFALAVTGDDPDGIEATATRMERLFDQPFEVGDRSQRLGVSVGVATAGRPTGEDTAAPVTDAKTLLDEASLAVGVARMSTTRRVVAFEPEMRQSVADRHELASDLTVALARHQLSLVYQPVIEIESRRVRGVEALLRWNHPERGPVSPAQFIPLAERSGLILEIGRWVLAEACRQVVQWHQRIDGAGNLSVSVNVSAIQLEREGEAERLAQIVLDSGLDPTSVTAELTESTLLEDADWIHQQLQVMRDVGMRVAVDDFGTGAAGFGHLRDIPFNVVKIDKRFIEVLRKSDETTRLVKGVIDLAHDLGAETVAEGIEDSFEFSLLQTLGCELAQGFYLGRPMEPTQLETWFVDGRRGLSSGLIVEHARGA